ncbi:MAG: hypothetical protein KC620_14010, partial [Myxococcales bacterium]|nr:hypothetical protein [Myxococcales bacterium]
MFARIRPLSRPPHGGLLRALAATGLVGAAWLTPAPAPGAEVTETIDAADGDDPFDFRGEVDYRRKLRRAKITREFNCNPARGREAESCPGAGAQGALLHVKELRYERIRHTITP